MSDAAFIATQVCTTAAAIAAGYFAVLAKQKASETHDLVNSRMTKFLKMAEESFKAKGKLEEKQEEAIRRSEAKD